MLALDAGSRRTKLLLVESDFGRVRVIKEEMLDLHREGLVSAEELKAHLQARLEDWGNPPLALALPQHLSISQVLELPQAPESEVAKLIAEETVKLGGVSESKIIYDFVRTETTVSGRQQFWVTLCREEDIRERIQQAEIEKENLCEITTVANALIAAYRATGVSSQRVVLAEMGAQTTVLVVLLGGEGVFATSFQMGGDFVSRALARLKGCSEEEAERLKRTTNLLSGPDALPEFCAVVDGWASELKRQLAQWFEHHSGEAPNQFKWFASGGGFEQPGLLEYLRGKGGVDLRPWPAGEDGGQGSEVRDRRTEDTEQRTEVRSQGSGFRGQTADDGARPAKGFEVAFGTALQALGYSPQPVSLLPQDYRRAWQKRLNRQRLELASLAVLVFCAVLLSFETWQQNSIFHRKEALQNKIEAARNAVQENEALSGELMAEYANLRPIFLRQQNTLDTLKALSQLQQSRSNQNFWYVLVADQQSYFSLSSGFSGTNRTARTNNISAIAPPSTASADARYSRSDPSDLSARQEGSPAKPGLITELCIPGDAEAARAVLGQLVEHLKPRPLFANVDQLPRDLRRDLADPKVTIPDRDFVLALDFADTRFLQQPLGVKPASMRTTRNRK
ncbi:MAG: hypothetical protein C5B50_09100 [Verrucomicrobia bacterium]|nr:MAG: hypothetical protein C5B50_09100 [Verrucomicrobiota bacterium]